MLKGIFDSQNPLAMFEITQRAIPLTQSNFAPLLVSLEAVWRLTRYHPLDRKRLERLPRSDWDQQKLLIAGLAVLAGRASLQDIPIRRGEPRQLMFVLRIDLSTDIKQRNDEHANMCFRQELGEGHDRYEERLVEEAPGCDRSGRRYSLRIGLCTGRE